jgi:peptide deformylase
VRTPPPRSGEITDEIRAIWDDMIDTMEAMPGVGLAAPQIGVMLRLAVVDCSTERGQGGAHGQPRDPARLDPGASTGRRGARTCPASARRSRAPPVTCAFTDHQGMRVRETFEDLWATSVQHQIDHLNGMIYADRLSKTKRDMLLRKARKKG